MSANANKAWILLLASRLGPFFPMLFEVEENDQ